MLEDLNVLEAERQRLYQEFPPRGDFRLGSISVTFGKCGKRQCVCAQKDHPGHGPHYRWTATRNGKTMAQHLRLGPELEQARRQVEAGHRFQEWYQKVIETNEQICRMKPVFAIEDEKELDTLKKKLQRKFFSRRKRKSTG